MTSTFRPMPALEANRCGGEIVVPALRLLLNQVTLLGMTCNLSAVRPVLRAAVTRGHGALA